jgi:hypothetical protein
MFHHLRVRGSSIGSVDTSLVSWHPARAARTAPCAGRSPSAFTRAQRIGGFWEHIADFRTHTAAGPLCAVRIPDIASPTPRIFYSLPPPSQRLLRLRAITCAGRFHHRRDPRPDPFRQRVPQGKAKRKAKSFERKRSGHLSIASSLITLFIVHSIAAMMAHEKVARPLSSPFVF